MTPKRLFGSLVLGLFLAVSLSFSTSSPLAQRDFEEWKKQRQQERQQFMEERDRKFQQFLKERWEKMREIANSPMYSDPKLPEIPEADSDEPDETREVTPAEPEEPSEQPADRPDNAESPESTSEDQATEPAEPEKPDAPRETEPASESKPSRDSMYPDTLRNPVEFDYYGRQVRVSHPADLPEVPRGSDYGEAIATFWENYRSMDNPTLLSEIKFYRDDLNLHGWHLLNFIHTVTGELTRGSQTTLLTWALMLDLGYDVRIAHDGSSYRLLYHTPRTIPGTSYLRLGQADSRRYYLFSDGQSGFQTYPNNYETARKPVHPEVSELPDLPFKAVQSTISFRFNQQQYDIPVTYNQNIVEYMRRAPRVSLGYYFDDYRPPGIKQGFLERVGNEMDGLSEWESINLLLRLTQKGFEYKTDQEQFNGEEVWMVPPQTVHYPFADCDDRSVFFGWLVQNLMDRNVIGVKWPGHLSTAVEYRGEPRGQYVSVDQSTYLLADPTYIGAGPGKVMPNYQNQRPELLFPDR